MNTTTPINSEEEIIKELKCNKKTHQKRTIEFKLRVWILHQEGMSAKDAFVKACEEFGTTPSGCMTNYSTSYMWDYKIELTKRGLI